MIVPTLDTPCPSGKNVIWCSSFQLAWNEIRDKVIGAPLTVVGAEEVAARLNTAKPVGSDLEPGTFYAAGGRVKDGIINKIKKDMATKFPSHVPPDFAPYAQERDGILAYSYLTARVPFPHPFRQAHVAFGNSRGQKIEVEAFGVWGYGDQYEDIRRQVEILYCELERDWRRVRECAVDLCKDSQPYQVIVAIVEPRGSLGQTLEYVRQGTANSAKSSDYEYHRRLGSVDVVMVPEMLWKIDHRFGDLIGKLVTNANPAMPILEAMQTVEFRLDRSGAVLDTEARYPREGPSQGVHLRPAVPGLHAEAGGGAAVLRDVGGQRRTADPQVTVQEILPLWGSGDGLGWRHSLQYIELTPDR